MLLTLIVVGCIRIIDIETSKPHRYLQSDENLGGKENWFGNATRAEQEYINNNGVAGAAYKRDKGYDGVAPVANDLLIWKKEAFNHVYGKCYKITDETTCKKGEDGAAPCSWTNGRCSGV